MPEPRSEPYRIALDAVHEALRDLKVAAYAPVQGQAMHKVITESVLESLRAHGYRIVHEGRLRDALPVALEDDDAV